MGYFSKIKQSLSICDTIRAHFGHEWEWGNLLAELVCNHNPTLIKMLTNTNKASKRKHSLSTTPSSSFGQCLSCDELWQRVMRGLIRGLVHGFIFNSSYLSISHMNTHKEIPSINWIRQEVPYEQEMNGPKESNYIVITDGSQPWDQTLLILISNI